ncbi:MAG: urease accessory protein UreE [Desulfopila sp.]
MLELTRKATGGRPERSVQLSWQKRVRSRLRVRLDNGAEAGIFLARGTVLRGGDILVGKDGELVAVVAEPETVSVVRVEDSLLFARLCYHLGNRHVPLAIRPGCLCYLHDHVLDAMVVKLGGSVSVAEAPFEPEHGAYAGHDHSAGGHHHD